MGEVLAVRRAPSAGGEEAMWEAHWIPSPDANMVCDANDEAVEDYAYLPWGPTDVTIRVTDKGGRVTEITRQFEVTNARLDDWMQRLDQLRQEIQNSDRDATTKELGLLLVDGSEAFLKAHKPGGAQGLQNWLQEWKNFLENWDGVLNGEQVLTPEQISNWLQEADRLLEILNSPNEDLTKKALLAIPAIVGVAIGAVVAYALGYLYGCAVCRRMYVYKPRLYLACGLGGVMAGVVGYANPVSGIITGAAGAGICSACFAVLDTGEC